MFGDRQGAARFIAREPFLLETEVSDLCADMAGDVRPSFAPVEARAAIDASALCRRREVDAEFGEEGAAGIGHFAGIAFEGDMTARDQSIRYADADPARDMVVA